MPVWIGPLVGFGIGAALAFWCRDEARRDAADLAASRHVVAALFGGLVFAPACAYFMVFAPDWALFYRVDSRAVPSAVMLLVVLLDAAAVAGGFAAGYRAARAGARWLPSLAGAPLAIATLVAGSFLGPLRIDGTFQQVSAGFGTRPVFGGPLGFAVTWVWASIIVGAVLAARALDPSVVSGRSR